MKKLAITLILVGVVVIANAQTEFTFKRFKFDISAGYALPISTSDNTGGFLISLEPKFAVTDQISLGLKAETAISITGDENTGKVRGSGSYLATGDFYLSSNTVRPFIGAGVGIYTHASADINSNNEDIQGTSAFGFAPRVGVEVAHFRAAFEYNFAGTVEGVNKNYLGIKMGVLIGGGRINY